MDRWVGGVGSAGAAVGSVTQADSVVMDPMVEEFSKGAGDNLRYPGAADWVVLDLDRSAAGAGYGSPACGMNMCASRCSSTVWD